MGIIAFILFLTVIFLWFQYKKAVNLANQNYKAVNQNVLMLTFYSQLLYILMEQKNSKKMTIINSCAHCGMLTVGQYHAIKKILKNGLEFVTP